MYTVLTLIVIIISALLIVLVLLQPGKGELSASFGGLGSQMGSMFGMQKTMSILAKATRIIAGIIVVIVLIINIFFVSSVEITTQKAVTEGAEVPTSNMAPPPVPVQPQKK